MKAPNKGVAESIIFGKLAEIYPEHIDDYFKPKVWEDREGLPGVVANTGFHDDFFDDSVIWNAETGEPERVLAEPELADDGEQLNDGAAEQKMTVVKPLPANYRAASLVLFGPVEEITAAQYGQVMDLVHDDESSFARELAEAIAREPCVLALLPERQEELLAHIRETVKETAQWTDIKRPINKWMDTPPAQRESVRLNESGIETGNETHTESGCTLGGGNPTDRILPHTLATLRREVCIGILSIAMDFDIYELPHAVHERAKKMEETGTDERFTAWWKQFRRTPGILDYSKAAIIALIKTSPEDIYRDPVKLREYINKNLTESDHANPDPLIVDIACGRTSAPLPQKNNEVSLNNQTEQTLPGETEIPAVCPARAAELDRELNAAFANGAPAERDEELRHKTSLMLAQQRGECIPELGDDPTDPKWDSMAGSASNEGEKTEVTEQEDDRPLLDDHEIEIAHALNDLLSGRTDIMGKEEAEGVVACTGHIIADVLPLLIIDIATTEFCLSPNFSDEEIHDVATMILDGWSDDAAVRQKVSLDAIVEYRRPEPPKAVVIDPPVITAKPKKEPEPTPEPASESSALTYRQQLMIAALQGVCANPAYRSCEELGFFIVDLVDEVIRTEAGL
ncbi:TPA: hypothetical protein ACNVDX_003682 [Citrobacter gillenii]